MSTTAPLPGASPGVPAPAPERNEIKVVSHSNLFYWWPVWAVGFLMALLTLIDRSVMATVPAGSRAAFSPSVTIEKPDGEEEKLTNREVIILARDEKHPERKSLARENPSDPKSQIKQPKVHMSASKNYGVIFCVTLLVCIVITNVPLRGMWSLVVIITVVLVSVILVLADLWTYIVTKLSYLDIRINMGGYLFIAGVLFTAWLITVLFFDQQVYIIFTPGQFKVCTEIGGGEKVYDTMGMKLERQRSDLFRHMILGLGSGDLIVKTSGAQADHFDLPNVLFIRHKVQKIEELLQKKKVVGSN